MSERSAKHALPVKYKLGPVTTNPFLNFLRDFRKNVSGKSVVDIAKEGGKAWWKLSEEERTEYRTRAKAKAHRKGHRHKRKPHKRRKGADGKDKRAGRAVCC